MLKQTRTVSRKDEKAQEKQIVTTSDDESKENFYTGLVDKTQLTYIGNLKHTRDKEEKELNELFNASKMDENKSKITNICIQNVQVPARSILDDAISKYSNLTDLSLQDIDIVPQECLQLASDPRVKNLTHLDLSCNPIGFKGLCNLLNAQTSQLGKLEHLELYSCELGGNYQPRG